MRKKILERNWLEIEKQESNPTQTWHRLRDNANKAINDLILLAQKLPEDKQKEIFTPNIINRLINQILRGGGETYSNRLIFDPRKAELAATLMEIGTSYNSTRYHLLNKDTPSLVEPTINHLKEAVSICKDIARKLELKKIEEEAEQMDLVYLFSWKKMLHEEKGRLEDYTNDKTDDGVIGDILAGTIKRTDEKIQCGFGVDLGESKYAISRSISITINDSKTSAEVLIFGGYDNLIYKENILAKPVENDSKDFNLYMYKTNKKRRS